MLKREQMDLVRNVQNSQPQLAKVELVKSENAWKRLSEVTEGMSDAEKDTAVLYGKFLSILNKLTPQKFQKLAEQAKELAEKMNTLERMDSCVEKLFHKALKEPLYSVAYARLSLVLTPYKVTIVGEDGQPEQKSFRALLLTKCQQESQKEEDEHLEQLKAAVEAAETEEEKKQRQAKYEAEEFKSRHRSLGNIRFIGELFKVKLLSEVIVHECIQRLLKSVANEKSLECFAKLMTTVGKELDHDKGQNLMERYFNRVAHTIEVNRIGSRVKFMLQDVVDLRKNNWVPRKIAAANVPTTIDKIHADHHQQDLKTADEVILSQDMELYPTREQGSLQSQNQQLTSQDLKMADEVILSQDMELYPTREQGSLQSQNQQLTSQVQQQARQLSALTEQNRTQQQQLTDQLDEHSRVIQEMQQQLQSLIQQVQSLQPSWSIAQHHLQITTQVLGSGAWGEVRVGLFHGTKVAIKKMHDVIISNYNRELFEREMIIASKVRHPHLLLFIGAVTTGNLTIVTELMETSLRKLLEEEKLKVSHLHPISKDIACALAYLHSLPDPIVHRDISSANVLLNAKQDGWCAKLGDFGSANFQAKLGTVAPGAAIYSAPEALHPLQQGPKMDVYSFGILLFEMCVGKLIHQHNLQATKASVAKWSNDEKKFLGEFALRCTEISPDKRPNMADFVKQT